jgi:hypothetical protein
VGKVFGSCSFENCTFNHLNARKGRFSSCDFEGCKITNSDMTRAEFYDTHFKNCKFLGVDLAASDFDNCKLETTRFFKSNLSFISVEKVQVWESKKWVAIEDFSSFQNHLVLFYKSVFRNIYFITIFLHLGHKILICFNVL